MLAGMQELTYVEPERVEWREVPEPVLRGAGEALVRPLAVATCDLDAAIVHGQAPFPGPFPLGHESVGEVLAVGDTVASVRPGDRVAVPFQISCGACAFCARGLTANCTAVPRTSMYGIGAAGGGWGGTFADVVRVPFADHMLVKLPAEVSPAAAASAGDNVADAWRTVAPQLAARPGARVLILAGGGAGSIPLYAVAIARALGAERVDFHDRDRRRLTLAQALGAEAHPVETWPDRLGSYPITVDSSLDPTGLACALRSTEPGGHCTSISIYFGGPVPVPMLEMYMKGITFTTGRVHSRAVLPAVLELIAAGRIAPERVTTETASWRDAAEAVLHFSTKLVVLHGG
jgi:threonine dehydrogenase-like Zn-dependent dehydrogenase